MAHDCAPAALTTGRGTASQYAVEPGGVCRIPDGTNVRIAGRTPQLHFLLVTTGIQVPTEGPEALSTTSLRCPQDCNILTEDRGVVAGRGRRRWSNQRKEGLNTCAITFDGLPSANRK